MNIKPNIIHDNTAFVDIANEEYNEIDTIELLVSNKFEMEIKGDCILLKRKKPQYPKTYDECCEVLGIEPYARSLGYKANLITAFRNLLICRDAYWKIAGDWKPNWEDGIEKYTIEYNENKIFPKETTTFLSRILTFHTEEMRDAFYENVRELIEECKELL